jgi:hypothetical protein
MMDLTQVTDDELENETYRRQKVKDDYYAELRRQREKERQIKRLADIKRYLAEYGVELDDEKAVDLYSDMVGIWHEYDY